MKKFILETSKIYAYKLMVVLILGPAIAALGEGHFGLLTKRLAFLCLEDDSIPFDKYYPSVAPKVSTQICTTCKHYYPTKKALMEHKKAKICGNYSVRILDDFEDPNDSDGDTDDEFRVGDPDQVSDSGLQINSKFCCLLV